MRHLSTYSIGFLLAVLLISTTPVGTGIGAHQLDLLHPLFSHVHVVNGRLLTHEQLSQSDSASSPDAPLRGPAVGAGSGSAPGDGGPGLIPTLPLLQMISVPVAPHAWLGATVPM